MDKILTRHEVTGHECEFPEDALPAWRGLGWIPVSEFAEQPTSSEAAPPADVNAATPPDKPAARRRANDSEE